MKKSLFLSVAASIALAACASDGGSDLPVGEFASMGAVQTIAPDYKIGPLDKLSIIVFQSKDLSYPSIQVDSGGLLLLPMIGRVHAAGKTTTELSDELSQKLTECCLQKPDVAVTVTDAISQQVTVTGAVKTSGVFILRGRTSLLQAVSMAGGPDRDTANTKRVAVYRVVDGQRMGALFNLDEIRKGEAEDPQILAGDTIIVDSSRTKGAFRNIMSAIPLFSVWRPF
ncbi:MAG TPA: polysaccharide biosynthesis/export family protein [Caulobacteraceae bacterium]